MSACEDPDLPFNLLTAASGGAGERSFALTAALPAGAPPTTRQHHEVRCCALLASDEHGPLCHASLAATASSPEACCPSAEPLVTLVVLAPDAPCCNQPRHLAISFAFIASWALWAGLPLPCAIDLCMWFLFKNTGTTMHAGRSQTADAAAEHAVRRRSAHAAARERSAHQQLRQLRSRETACSLCRHPMHMLQ